MRHAIAWTTMAKIPPAAPSFPLEENKLTLPPIPPFPPGPVEELPSQSSPFLCGSWDALGSIRARRSRASIATFLLVLVFFSALARGANDTCDTSWNEDGGRGTRASVRKHRAGWEDLRCTCRKRKGNGRRRGVELTDTYGRCRSPDS